MPQLVPFYYTRQANISYIFKYKIWGVFSNYCPINFAMVKRDALDFSKNIDNTSDNLDGLDFYPDIFSEQNANLYAKTATLFSIPK